MKEGTQSGRGERGGGMEKGKRGEGGEVVGEGGKILEET